MIYWSASPCTMLVYIISLYFLALDNLFVRSIAGEFILDGKSESVFRPDDLSLSIKVSDSHNLKEQVIVVGKNASKKSVSKILFEHKGKAITAAIAIAVLIIAIRLLKKKKKLRLRRKLAEASNALRAELFEWEHLYDKELDFKTFLSTCEKRNQDFIDNFKHVFYSANLLADRKILPLEDPELQKEKDRLWKKKIEPYYRKADYVSFLRLRSLFSEMAEKIVSLGFRNGGLEDYNVFSSKPFVFDFNGFKEFIDKQKSAEAPDDAIKMCEFFAAHCVKAMGLCNSYGTARRNYYRIFQDHHVRLLSLGKKFEE